MEKYAQSEMHRERSDNQFLCVIALIEHINICGGMDGRLTITMQKNRAMDGNI